MPEKIIETANLKVPERVKQTIGMTVRVDYQTRKDLDLIASYEREKRAPLMRRILIEKIQVYKRNPAFKRWVKQLKEMQERK